MKEAATQQPSRDGPKARPGAAVARVGAFTAACVLVSNAIGSGIFTTTGFMARDLGDPAWILALWLAGGGLALAGAMSYSELGAALPRVGGEYVYLRRAYGALPAFLSGWTSFTMGFGAAIAAGSVSFALYLVELLPADFPIRRPTLFALALVWAVTAVHAAGVERGGSLQRWLTILKVGAMGLLVVAAAAWGEGSFGHLAERSADVRPSAGAAFVALIFVLYAFSGWNAAAYIAGEIRAPGRNLPRAMIAGTLFISAVYVALNLVYLYALPVSALAQEPVLPVAEKAASALFGPGAATAIVATLCLSIAGATSSMVWAGPRVYYAMSRDGVAPALFGRTSESGTPVASILLQSAWVTLLLFSGTFEQLVVYSGVAIAIFSALAVSAVFVLRVREPELPRPYRVAPYPWVPLAYVVSALGIAGWATWGRPVETLLAAATVLAGVPLYALARRRRP